MDVDALIGTIALFPYNFTPQGWMSCDGQTLSITQYQALFALIGTQFGGNGATNFMLPNLNGTNGAQPLSSMRYFIATTGIFPTRS